MDEVIGTHRATAGDHQPATAFTAASLSSEAAGRVIVDAATVRRLRTRYTIGHDAAVLVRLSRLLSDRVLDHVLAATCVRTSRKSRPSDSPTRSRGRAGPGSRSPWPIETSDDGTIW